jgi:hypothetical protein
MGMFIPLQSIEVVDDQQYAGMTQVVNIHTKTILACEEGSVSTSRRGCLSSLGQSDIARLYR